jgi:predicted nucleic acid-binding protein
VIVVDASAAVCALLNAGPARQALADEQVHFPHLIDSEVANALSRGVAASRIEPGDAWTALDRWRRTESYRRLASKKLIALLD